MGFFRKIKDSIYSPSFYASIPQKSLGEALKYFFLFILLLSLLQVLSTIPLFTQINKEVPAAVKLLVSKYPADLKVKITNGVVSTNVEEPYFVPVKKGTSSKYTNIIVIDTKNPYTTEQFDKYDAYAWLTKDLLYYRSNTDSNQIKVVDLSQVKDISISKKSLEDLMTKFMPMLSMLGLIMAPLMFVVMLIAHTFRLLYLLFLAVLILIAGKLLSFQIGYKQAYKVSCYAITLPYLIGFVMDLTSGWTHFTGFAFSFTIFAMIAVIINFANADKTVAKATMESKAEKAPEKK